MAETTRIRPRKLHKSAQDVGHLHCIGGIISAEMYGDILQKKMLSSLRRLGRGAIFQQENEKMVVKLYFSRTTKETTAFLYRRKVKIVKNG